MKTTLKILFVFISVLLFSSCSKDCASNNSPVCAETAPTDEACQAFFQRWFYNPTTQQCEQIGYSGCSQKGFASEAECSECICNN